MDMKKVVLAVVGIVVGILMVTHVVVPAVDTFLERPDVGGFTGLEPFARFLPLLAIMALVIGGLLVLFRRGDRGDTDTGHGGDAGLPPGYTRQVRLPWRRRRW